MNRFYKVSSKYSYYKYLEKYDAAFLRKYQSETHFYLGRRYVIQRKLLQKIQIKNKGVYL